MKNHTIRDTDTESRAVQKRAVQKRILRRWASNGHAFSVAGKGIWKNRFPSATTRDLRALALEAGIVLHSIPRGVTQVDALAYLQSFTR